MESVKGSREDISVYSTGDGVRGVGEFERDVQTPVASCGVEGFFVFPSGDRAERQSFSFGNGWVLAVGVHRGRSVCERRLR